MGVRYSSLRRDCRSTPHLPSPASYTCILRPPFLDLPLDILHCIFDHLEPEDCIAFALSCKDLHNWCFPRALERLRNPLTTRLQRQAVHLLLEKQCGDRSFYCNSCDGFHPFSTQWRATHSRLTLEHPRNDSFCQERSRFEPGASIFNPFKVDYTLARLVMNRHFIGPPAGLPLDCLEVEDLRRDHEAKPYTWTQTWRARIISDELMLSAVHTFSPLAVDDGFARSFKEGLDYEAPTRWYSKLCSHVAINSDRDLPCVARKGVGTTVLDLFVPCRDVEGSCTTCLTDFTTTITWIDGVTEADEAQQHFERTGYWSIVITTYHQLGKCRSPTDWKWAAARANAPWFLERRKDGEHCFGSVRRRWQGL